MNFYKMSLLSCRSLFLFHSETNYGNEWLMLLLLLQLFLLLQHCSDTTFSAILNWQRPLYSTSIVLYSTFLVLQVAASISFNWKKIWVAPRAPKNLSEFEIIRIRSGHFRAPYSQQYLGINFVHCCSSVDNWIDSLLIYVSRILCT